MPQPFLETPVFPDDLSFYALGGVSYNTTVVGSTSGRETRNSMWLYGRAQFDLQGSMRTTGGVADPFSIRTLRNFFRVCKGQAYGFRFRDWTDYQDEGNGLFGPLLPDYTTPVVPTLAATGQPQYQMFKTYIASPLYDYKPVQKPRPGTITVTRNGSPLVVGNSPGNYNLDTTTGILTMVADSSEAITGWGAPGTTTTFGVGAIPSGWAVGTSLYFSGITGDTNGAFNGQVHTIASISGTNVTVNVASTGLTLTGGSAYKYPQPSETLAWTGMFDLPARFATDVFAPQIEDDGTLYAFQTLTVAEIRL
jgi:uncharacterized protein (TIGR02217 family)